MRIALLVDPLTVRLKGGEHAFELARHLLDRGHEVRGFGANAEWFERGDASGTSWALAHPSSVLGFRPDALVAYDALSPAAWLGARAARRLRVPLVLVEAGAFARGTLLERGLWKIGQSLWGAYVRRTTARLIALDPVARDQALREGFHGARCLVIVHGVDLDRFKPGLSCATVARHRIPGRVLSYVGRLDSVAGVETLIGAFAQTAGQRPDWSLALAGRGQAQPRLRATADRLGVGTQVHFVGELDLSELPGLISASTLVALPELDDARGVGPILQAMACGVPVVASELPRWRALIEESQCGVLARPGDAASWSEHLRRLLLAPEGRAQLGANGLRHAQERFGWQRVAAAFEHTIEVARGERDDAGDALPIAS